MAPFFLAVELISYILLFYLWYKKGELVILYLPAFLYSNVIIEPVISASVSYGVVTFILLYSIVRNGSFFRNNIFALFLMIYFACLIPRSENLEEIRPYLFSVFWLFTCIPLIAEIYRKYDKSTLFDEVSNTGVLVLILFIANVVVSTINRYAPTEMYGITSGVLYGQLFATDFNILPMAVFLTSSKFLKERKSYLLVILVLALAFLMLSMRRSVMSTSLLGMGLALLTLLTQRDAKKFILIGGVIALIGYIIYANTDFMNQFNERVALRNLEDKALEEESRFLEYELVYTDMFIYNDYSPWFGFDLFNSDENYGRAFFEDRTIHADLANIAHSSGLIGVFLYLLMVITAFIQAFKATVTTNDKLLFFFCCIVFGLFTITGRYTQLDSMLLIFLTLFLPLANVNEVSEDVIEFEEIPAENDQIISYRL